MSGSLRVSSEAVGAAGVAAAGLVEEFQARLNLCDQVASALVQESWTGPASRMFDAGWSEWSRGALEVKAALAAIAHLLQEAAAQYESTVTDIASSSSVVSGEATR